MAFERYWGPAHEEGTWRTRRDAAAAHFVPWLDGLRPLSTATVLEYGSGTGAVGCGFGPSVERHIGYDIAVEATSLGRELVRREGLDNVELHVIPPERIHDAIRAHSGEPDIVLLYAVLEHMTIDERLRLLEMVGEVARPGGLVVVAESPNRLIGPDWHTSFLPFFAQLPDELALRLAGHSPREDFRTSLREAASHGHEPAREALVRWGRGVSYHEFELVFGELDRRVLAGGYEPALLPVRPVHPEELGLARQLDRTAVRTPPPLGRYWLDFAMSIDPVDPAEARLIWPWTMDTRGSPAAGWTRWDTIELPPGAELAIDLPCPTTRLLAAVALPEPEGEIVLSLGDSSLRAAVAGAPGSQLFAEFRLDRPRRRSSLQLSSPGYVHFVGYEAAMEPGLRQ
ncbi:MAG: methyltransferase domain-containing protein [Thermoleophilaceae bacterium]